MRLILRKNDSATSLLLFIYNNYYSKTSKYSLKLSSLLNILKAFDKNETAIRMSLSRAVKSGFLVNSKEGSEVVYTLSDMGKQSIELWNEGVINLWKRYKLRQQPWDGKWYFVNIEFSDDKKQKAEVIDKLQQLGFALINTNTWLCPYYQKDEINEAIDKFKLKTGVVEIYGEMNIRKDVDEFLEEVYQLDALKERYKEFISTYETKVIQIKELCKEEQFVSSGQALPLLHELGWQFFSVALDDAVLPKQLFPYWEGDVAASVMKEYRELLLDASWKFLDKFE